MAKRMLETRCVHQLVALDSDFLREYDEEIRHGDDTPHVIMTMFALHLARRFADYQYREHFASTPGNVIEQIATVLEEHLRLSDSDTRTLIQDSFIEDLYDANEWLYDYLMTTAGPLLGRAMLAYKSERLSWLFDIDELAHPVNAALGLRASRSAWGAINADDKRIVAFVTYFESHRPSTRRRWRDLLIRRDPCSAASRWPDIFVYKMIELVWESVKLRFNRGGALNQDEDAAFGRFWKLVRNHYRAGQLKSLAQSQLEKPPEARLPGDVQLIALLEKHA